MTPIRDLKNVLIKITRAFKQYVHVPIVQRPLAKNV